MYVCVCNAVTDSEIRKVVIDGVRNFAQLRRETGCGSNCGCCKDMANEIIQQTLAENSDYPRFLPLMQLS